MTYYMQKTLHFSLIHLLNVIFSESLYSLQKFGNIALPYYVWAVTEVAFDPPKELAHREKKKNPSMPVDINTHSNKHTSLDPGNP